MDLIITPNTGSTASQTNLINNFSKEGNITRIKSDSDSDTHETDELFTTPLAGAQPSPGKAFGDNIELINISGPVDDELYGHGQNPQTPVKESVALKMNNNNIKQEYKNENYPRDKDNKVHKSLMILLFLVLLYTFIGVTYLLFFAKPTCDCNDGIGSNALTTGQETFSPTMNPTHFPTTASPTSKPSFMPTLTPSFAPSTESPTVEPTVNPTFNPTLEPTTAIPTLEPTTPYPSRNPSKSPTISPTISTVADNYALIQGVYDMFPTGIVLIWYGTIITIPDGWVLCDGSNGTPDLRDRFVIGGGNLYHLGRTGGMTNLTLSTNHLPVHNHDLSNVVSTTHNGHTHDDGTYSISSVNSHTHTYSATTSSHSGHTHTWSDTSTSGGGHSHSISCSTGSGGSHTHGIPNMRVHEHDGDGSGGNHGYESHGGWTYNTNSGGSHSHSCYASSAYVSSHTHSVSGTTSTSGSHSHTLSGTSSSSGSHSHSLSGNSGSSGQHSHYINGETENVGSGHNIDIMNPYYAAYYIMKI